HKNPATPGTPISATITAIDAPRTKYIPRVSERPGAFFTGVPSVQEPPSTLAPVGRSRPWSTSPEGSEPGVSGGRSAACEPCGIGGHLPLPPPRPWLTDRGAHP